MVDLFAINPSEVDCNNCIGGIVRSGIIDCGYIDLAASTVDADGHITALAVTLAGADQAMEYIYTDDKTAKFDSIGERNIDRHVNNQDAGGKFNCLDNDKVKAGERLKSACCLVAMHDFSSGFQAVQGIDVIPDGVGYKLVFSLEKAKATVSAFSDVTSNSSRLEFSILSQSRNVLVPMADPATFGLDDFLAL